MRGRFYTFTYIFEFLKVDKRQKHTVSYQEQILLILKKQKHSAYIIYVYMYTYTKTNGIWIWLRKWNNFFPTLLYDRTQTLKWKYRISIITYFMDVKFSSVLDFNKNCLFITKTFKSLINQSRTKGVKFDRFIIGCKNLFRIALTF